MDGHRGKGLQRPESHAITSTGSTTSRLGTTISRVRRRVGHSNRKRTNATDRAQLVPTGLLLQPEAMHRGKKLLNN